MKAMRRKDREITDKERILDVVAGADVCRLGISDEFPYVVPLNFGHEVVDGKLVLYFHSALEGRKVDLLKKNPKVGIEMDTPKGLAYDDEKGSCTELYECVMGTGKVEFLDGDEKMHAIVKILEHYGREKNFVVLPELLARTLVYKVVCDNVSCKIH